MVAIVASENGNGKKKKKKSLEDRFSKISIFEARELARTTSLMIWWRPDSKLEEKDQYCLISKLVAKSA